MRKRVPNGRSTSLFGIDTALFRPHYAPPLVSSFGLESIMVVVVPKCL